MSAWNALRGLERLSLCDWPGRMAAVLFLGGCNLRCPYCHNAELAWHPERLPGIYPADVKRFLAQRAKWLDGVVVSGGEPTLAAGLPEMLSEIKALGLPVKLDTNGTAPGLLASLLAEDLIDGVSVDVKAPFDRYEEASGGRLTPELAGELFEGVFALAGRFPGRFAFRITVTPLTTAADVRAVKLLLPPGFTLKVQPFAKARREREESDHAAVDQKARRTRRDLVDRPGGPGHLEGPEGQRSERPDPGQAPGRQG